MMFNSAAPKLLLWGDDSRAFFNQAYLELMPMRLTASCIGRSCAQLQPELWDHIHLNVQSAMGGTPSLESSLRLESKQNGVQDSYFKLCYTPVQGPIDRVDGVLVDVYDVTATQLLENSLRSKNSQLSQLFAEVPFFIALFTGPDLNLEFVNQSPGKLLSRRSSRGEAFGNSIAAKSDRSLFALLKEAYTSGRTQWSSNFFLDQDPRESGREQQKILDLVCQPVRDETDSVYGVLLTAYDVTQRHLAQKEADRLQHRLLHNSRLDAMGTMAMTLAHELNQPLAAAGNYISTARRLLAKGANGSSEMLEHAQKEIARVGRVVGRARSLVRVGVAERSKVSIALASRAAIGLLEATGIHDLKITLSLSPDATHVLSEEIQLEQVFLNILRNAAEASRNCQRREAIVTSHRVSGNRVQIAIRDFGKGFPDNDVSDLFEKFSPSSGGGLGVGLALTRTLVDANQGTINASNHRDGGAIIRIELDAPDRFV